VTLPFGDGTSYRPDVVLIPEAGGRPIVYEVKGAHLGKVAWSRHGVERFRRAREAAGLPHITFHDLRHSCASLLINMGTPLEVIRDILGHTSVKTTERYAHLHIDRQQEALKKLAALI
jgi:integrase